MPARGWKLGYLRRPDRISTATSYVTTIHSAQHDPLDPKTRLGEGLVTLTFHVTKVDKTRISNKVNEREHAKSGSVRDRDTKSRHRVGDRGQAVVVSCVEGEMLG